MCIRDRSRLSSCEKFAKKHSITILLKGQEDIVSEELINEVEHLFAEVE